MGLNKNLLACFFLVFRFVYKCHYNDPIMLAKRLEL